VTDARTPLAALLARAGGVRGLVYTAVPITTFAATSSLLGLVPAVVAAVSVATLILGWQLLRRESTRPALFGFAGVAVGAAFAFVTGQAKDFYLPGIWMYLFLAIAFTISVMIRRPLVGVVWAGVTGRDDTWRRVPRVRLAFDIATIVMATVSWSRFLVQYYLYDTDQAGLLAIARIAMGWPVFVVTSSMIYFAIRVAIRALRDPTVSVAPSGGMRNQRMRQMTLRGAQCRVQGWAYTHGRGAALQRCEEVCHRSRREGQGAVAPPARRDNSAASSWRWWIAPWPSNITTSRSRSDRGIGSAARRSAGVSAPHRCAIACERATQPGIHGTAR
jgi:Protein of unknown function (DUF3159)